MKKFWVWAIFILIFSFPMAFFGCAKDENSNAKIQLDMTNARWNYNGGFETENAENLEKTEPQNVPYTITGSDLNWYKQTNSYVAGKANPFSASTSVDTPTNGVTNNTENGEKALKMIKDIYL